MDNREIDALILKTFFGVKKTYKTEWSTDHYYIPSGKPWRTHSIDARPVPRFTEDIAAAWTVVEKTSELPFAWTWALFTMMEGERGNFIRVGYPPTPNASFFEYVKARGDTMQQAIVQAALKAVGVEVGEPSAQVQQKPG